ncbi:hypothetical protein ABH930_002846 [Kitasatospora sp. GAS204A]|nr:hypothetical protein [Kitasatospora sp. GAS204B]
MVVDAVSGGDLADVRLWAGEIEAVHERFVHRFSREEPCQSALAYMRGLVAPLERKNGWTLAEETGHAGPDRIHRPLNRIRWYADEVLESVRDFVIEHLGDRDAVLIVDDTGFLKKGGPFGRGPAAELRHRGTHRELPDRGVPHLRDRPRTHADRPPSVSAHVVGGRR